MLVLVGLGNFGSQYEKTRHNVGFDTIDYLGAQYRVNSFKQKHKSLVADCIIQGKKILLVKPQTYMNNSGEALREIMDFYKLKVQDFIVIYDDIDLQPGHLRIRPKGSAGTHNGMRSIVNHLNSEDFTRIRIGIGKPPEKMNLANYVLQRFSEEERKNINIAIENAALAAVTILSSSVEIAMNKYSK